MENAKILFYKLYGMLLIGDRRHQRKADGRLRYRCIDVEDFLKDD